MKAATGDIEDLAHAINISIHAAREGGDIKLIIVRHNFTISIHAAREGGDFCGIGIYSADSYFNPRRP